MSEFMELTKKILVRLHGTDSCKRLADVPATEKLFAILRENVESEYSKYKGKIPDEQYEQFIEEVFQIYKEYKLNLDRVEEKKYGKVYGDAAEKIREVIHKYGIYSS